MKDPAQLWLPVLLYLLFILAFVAGILLLAHWLAPPRHRPVKDMPYESGMDPLGTARLRFNIRYYLVAVLFLLFDVELLFIAQRRGYKIREVPITWYFDADSRMRLVDDSLNMLREIWQIRQNWKRGVYAPKNNDLQQNRQPEV